MRVKASVPGIGPAVVVGLALLSGLLEGCGGADDPAASAASARPSDAPPSSAASPSIRILQPGKPGAPNRTVTALPEAPGRVPNDADLAFLQMMIPHHDQALDMAALAPSRSADARVRRLAERIAAAQRPEILAMAQWLRDWDAAVPRGAEDAAEFDHAAHGHDGMVGFLSPAQMRALAAADGPAFDRLFLRRMIGHHRGAIEMAGDVSEKGRDVLVAEMAADVAATQSAEIARMSDLLD